VGTASLVFGLLIIGLGIYLFYDAMIHSDTSSVENTLTQLVLGIISFLSGGLLLRKYDSDKKKEKK